MAQRLDRVMKLKLVTGPAVFPTATGSLQLHRRLCFNKNILFRAKRKSLFTLAAVIGKSLKLKFYLYLPVSLLE